MKLLTVKQVADLINAKPSTIYAWAEQGIIPFFKLNGLLRFSEADIFDWVISKKQKRVYNTLVGRKPKKGGQF
jgi:excisionase family DNA binding protein